MLAASFIARRLPSECPGLFALCNCSSDRSGGAARLLQHAALISLGTHLVISAFMIPSSCPSPAICLVNNCQLSSQESPAPLLFDKAGFSRLNAVPVQLWGETGYIWALRFCSAFPWLRLQVLQLGCCPCFEPVLAVPSLMGVQGIPLGMDILGIQPRARCTGLSRAFFNPQRGHIPSSHPSLLGE